MIAVLSSVRLAYTVMGQGEPLVLIAPMGCSMEVWHPLWLAMLAEQRTVICFDHRNIGSSVASSSRMDIKTMAGDVAALLDHLGYAQADIAGFSMGGMIAQQFAVDYGDKLARLILGCTAPRGLAGIRLWAGAILLLHLAPRMFMRAIFSDRYVREQPKEGEKFCVWMRSARPRLRVLLALTVAGLRFDSRKHLAAIAAPTLVLTAKGDRLIANRDSIKLGRAIDQAKVTLLAEAGHLFFLEKWQESAQAMLEFLSAPCLSPRRRAASLD